METKDARKWRLCLVCGRLVSPPMMQLLLVHCEVVEAGVVDIGGEPVPLLPGVNYGVALEHLGHWHVDLDDKVLPHLHHHPLRGSPRASHRRTLAAT